MNQDVLHRVLRSPRLPSLPTIALEVLALAQQQDADIQEVAHTIQHDPALSSKILRTVNSAFYGYSYPISTISRALVVLGLNAVKALTLSFSLVGELKQSAGQSFDHVEYWRRSLYSATAAKTLSEHAGIAQQEEVFLGGLLQDIGMVAMSQALGQEYALLLERAGAHHASLRDHENATWGLDHAEVGAALATEWRFPPVLVALIRYHEDPDGAEEGLLPPVRCVALGNRVADIFLSEERGGEALDAYYTQAEAWFGLPRDQAEPLLKQVHQYTLEMGRLFDLPTGDLGNPDEILARATEMLMQITLEAQQENTQLISDANTDFLTGTLNRRAFDQCAEEQFQLATASRPVSLLFMDVDRLKAFNDSHGHAVGDRVLIACAETLRKAVGARGRVFRYGGEEFAIVCPGVDSQAAAQIAEQTRRAVEDQARVHDDDGRQLSITCSIGVATHTGDTFDRGPQLVRAADQGVYAAKAAGRNCVRIWSPGNRAAGSAFETAESVSENDIRSSPDLVHPIRRRRPDGVSDANGDQTVEPVVPR